MAQRREPGARRLVRAMNGDVELVSFALHGPRRLARAERWLRAFEARYSRFQPLSEVSRLNAAAGRPFRASKGLYALVALALRLARHSGGIFDPTVLRHLEAAGYDRSFERIEPRTHGPPIAAGPPSRWREVRLDPAARTITLPPDAGIDLGGIGKGWAADRLAAILGSPSLVNAGGDVFAAGAPPGEPAWRIGVADPFQPERDLLALAVVDAGVATSSSVRRRWRAGSLWMHHLIDPRTGRPAASDIAQVTVVAPSAALADYNAKVVLILGEEKGGPWLRRQQGVAALIVRRNGALVRGPGLAPYLPA